MTQWQLHNIVEDYSTLLSLIFTKDINNALDIRIEWYELFQLITNKEYNWSESVQYKFVQLQWNVQIQTSM